MSEDGENLKFGETVIFYNLVFDIGKPIDPMKSARKLLTTNFANTSTNYISNTVEVAERFKELIYLQDKANYLMELNDIIKNGRLLGIIPWALSHPKTAYFFLTQYWASNKNKDNTNNGLEKGDNRDNKKILNDTIKMINQSMVDEQKLDSLHMYSDYLLFSPLYLYDLPFVRIGLQSFTAWIDDEPIGVDVELVLHRAGVANLSFYVDYQDEKTAKQLIHYSISKNVIIKQLRISKDIMDITYSSYGLNTFDIDQLSIKKDKSSGIEWYNFEHLTNITLENVFDAYETAILSAIHNKLPKSNDEYNSWLRTSDWFAYPIIYIRKLPPECPTVDTFKLGYKSLLAGLISRYKDWNLINPQRIDELIKNDLSWSSNYSLYIGESHSLVIYDEKRRNELIQRFGTQIPGQEWIFDYFQTSGLVEMLLIQKWIFHTLRSDLRKLSYNINKLNNTKKFLLLALEEYYAYIFSMGTAQDIYKSSYKTMRIDDYYNEIMTKLTVIEKFVEVENNNSQNRHNIILQIIILIATIIIGGASANAFALAINSIEPQWSILSITIAYLIVLIAPLIIYLIYLASKVVINLLKKDKPIIQYDQSESAIKKGFIWSSTIRWKPRK